MEWSITSKKDQIMALNSSPAITKRPFEKLELCKLSSAKSCLYGRFEIHKRRSAM